MTINGRRLAYWGCCLESGDELLKPHPLKPFPRNDNRLEHGVEVLRDAPRYDSKEFTLVFNFYKTDVDVYKRIDDFMEEIYRGGNAVYYKGKYFVLDYISSVSFESYKGTASLGVRFECTNPYDGEGLGDYSDDYSNDYLI